MNDLACRDVEDLIIAYAADALEAPMVRKTATRRFWSAPSFSYALAAVLAIVAIGLGEWGLSRGGNDAGVLVQRPLRVAPLCA